VSAAHAVLYRLIQAARREPVMRVLRELEQTQWWAEERLREDQIGRLRRVLEAAVRAPHYRLAWAAAGAVPGDVRSTADLARLPRLEKVDLRADPGRVRDPAYSGPLNVQVTSGSSGVPLKLFRSRLAGAYGRAAQIRGRRWFGLGLGEREVRFGGISLERLGIVRARIVDRLMNRVRLSAFDLSEARLEEFLAIVRRIRPALLYGYPSALALFAAYAEHRGSGRALGLRAVFCSSERLFDHRRALIARAFGCPVVDEYGAAEVSILGMECPAGSLHQATENALVEITDAAGRAVPEGQPGEVVATDLNNLAAPLVRYRLGDMARLVTGGCSCGRGLPRLEILEGSSFGLVALPDGRRLSGVAFYFLAESLITRPDAGIREMVLVRRGDAFIARVVPRAGGDPAHLAELRRGLSELLGPSVRLTIDPVERIDRRGGDKFRILLEETS